MIHHRCIATARGALASAQIAITTTLTLILAVAALVLPGAANATKIEFKNVGMNGPHVTAASISHGELHLRLTFHAAGRFHALILSNPPKDPSKAKFFNLVRSVSLGQHAAGPGTVSIPLGTLTPGRYGVIVTPVKQPTKVTSKNAATWVYFTEHQGGKATGIRLIQPPA